MVARVLSAFDLAGCERDIRWRAQVKDLRRVLAADYRGAVRESYHSGLLPVRSFLDDAARHFPDLNVRPIRLDAGVHATAFRLGITLRLQDYARRLALRGFYHRDPKVGPIIWVNLAHHPGAVAGSLAHELGHFYRERLLGSPADGTSIPFFNADFSGHLTCPAELFADLFVVFAGYPTAIAARLFARGKSRETVRETAGLDGRTLKRLRQYMSRTYGFGADQRGPWRTPRRIAYLSSLLHFARLRRALLQEIGI